MARPIQGGSALPVAIVNAEGELLTTRPNTGVDALTVSIGPTDPISDIPVVMDFEHHQVHEGESYEYNNLVASLAINTNKDFRINVPAELNTTQKACHMIMQVTTTLEAEVYIYEDMTFTGGNGGTQRTAVNRNRLSSNTPKTTLFEDPTPATTGTNIWIGLAGSGIRAGGEARPESEFDLKPANYLLRVTSRANSNKVLIRFLWYEDLGV